MIQTDSATVFPLVLTIEVMESLLKYSTYMHKPPSWHFIFTKTPI